MGASVKRQTGKAHKGGIAWTQVVNDLGEKWTLYQVKKRWGEVEDKQSIGHDSDSEDSVEDGNEVGKDEGGHNDVMENMVKRMAELEKENRNLRKTHKHSHDDDDISPVDGGKEGKHHKKSRKEMKKAKKEKKFQRLEVVVPTTSSTKPLGYEQLEALYSNNERMIRLAAYDKEKGIKDQLILMGMGK